MFRKLRPRSAYDVVALLALFVALGGTTYAAATIGPNDLRNDAVRSRHIKNGEVKNLDLGANSVGAGKVRPNSLTGRNINEATLSGSQIRGVNAAALRGKTLNDWRMELPAPVNGPLPQDASFTTHGGQGLLLVDGSAYRSTLTEGTIGVSAEIIDPGNPFVYAQSSTIFTNERNSHKAVPTIALPLSLVPAGVHHVRISAIYLAACSTGAETPSSICTTTDGNDSFKLTYIEFPRP